MVAVDRIIVVFMRLRPFVWFVLSMVCFAAAFYFWRLGDRWATGQSSSAVDQAAAGSNLTSTPGPGGQATPRVSLPVRLLSEAGNLNLSPAAVTRITPSSNDSRFAYRLSNTPEPLSRLARNPTAIILENGLLDTTISGELRIPDHLRAQGEPGAYIVQARGPVDDQFRWALKQAGATVISYIPNNAYLVRASGAAASSLESLDQTRAVLPYEPYYKLRASLLPLAVNQQALPQEATLNLLLFADLMEETVSRVQDLQIAILGEDRSPFGPVLKVRPASASLSGIAALPGVQAIELAGIRVLANDLSRPVLHVAPDAITNGNHFGLTGTNVIVNVNDTGVDASHPALLAPRVTGDSAISLVDTNGHGTFVAGIIAGDGAESQSISNAQGSPLPPVAGQFRGHAPGAKIFSMPFTEPDWYLQEGAALTNALISNNSWQYLRSSEYDLAAASYDAAVRDSLPRVTGSQPVLYVFPSGNSGLLDEWSGAANNDGLGGVPDTIRSPGTAKNVITVGATELKRGITNEVYECDSGNNCQTNAVWKATTDSYTEVAGFSRRGNVGIGIEGEFGRFKPDLVAPGTFVVSTRSSQWDEDAYYNATSRSVDFIPGLVVTTNDMYRTGIYIPDNAVQLIIRATAIRPLGADLPIYINNAFVANNVVTLPPDAPLGPFNDYLDYQIGNNTNQDITFNLETVLVTTNENGNYFDVLREANDQLGQFYRYESGTSLAAAQVAGTLALMHDFFINNLGRTNSPALMKALLINGARSASDIYDLQVQNAINYQGWGLVNLPNSLPGALSNAITGATSSPVFAFDQSPTNALATGQTETRVLQLSEGARNQPLRATLVWTDPPGNPVAGVKLVNDLDLVVTNLDTGEVFFGNDFQDGNDFVLSWSTNNAPNIDVVNNVENVYLKEPLGTNYSISVIARHVNVNAVTAHPDNVVQDFALVLSSGNGDLTNALSLASTATVTLTVPFVTYMTNGFPDNPGARVTGGLLTGQHVGANTPLIGTNTLPLPGGANLMTGMTNQWHFYTLSNEMSFTNAAFVTFLPPTLAIPRMGVDESDPDNATRLEADIDLYVTTNPGLTNLDPVAISTAMKSQGRGGTEVIALSNAEPGAVYYVGVKSEDQQAAEYSFLGIFSENPFAATDGSGNQTLFGLPVPVVIPEGTTEQPQAAQIIALSIQPITIRRVVVTNTFTHSFPGNLIGTIAHGRTFSVLNNKTCITDAGGDCITNTLDYIYEDNGEGDIAFSRPPDGPGDLKEFIGEEGVGVWLFNMVNNFPASTGRVDRFLVRLEPQNISPGSATERDLLPNSWTYDSIDVPPNATNLIVCVSGNTDPIELYVANGYAPSRDTYDHKLDINPPGNCLSITPYSVPPLAPGRYFIGVFNPSLNVQRIRLTAEVQLNPFMVGTSIPSSLGGVPLLDDAVTYSTIFVTNRLSVSDLDVGVLIRHDRISDLALTLISPTGTRILLFENRGAGSTEGLGSMSTVTNEFGLPVFATTNFARFWTNDFDASPVGLYAPGARFQGWDVLSNFVAVLPDYSLSWRSNQFLSLGYGAISNSLPTTNSTAYRLEYQVTHAPYLVGTVGWWPFEQDANDIFGGWDGLLAGGGDIFSVATNSYAMFDDGYVSRAFFGDGIRTSVKIPAAPELDLGAGRTGFSIEGWVKPKDVSDDPTLIRGAVALDNGFENEVPRFAVLAGSIVSGWSVESGDIDVLALQAPFNTKPHSGTNCIDLNGNTTGAVSIDFNTTPGRDYLLEFAYSRNPGTLNPAFVASAEVSITGQDAWRLSYAASNTYANLNWFTTSRVFTATAPVTKLTLTSLNSGNGGMFLDSFKTTEVFRRVQTPAPIAEWSLASTNSVAEPTQGVQFWLGGTNRTSLVPGALAAVVWTTNGLSYPLLSPTNSITNSGWQHVAMTFEPAAGTVKLFANGQMVASRVLGGDLVPRTYGDLYFGFHPGSVSNLATFSGGFDEFGLYRRALTDCEVGAIFAAGSLGKYGTNVLGCPVAHTLEITTINGTESFTITNGLTWTNGPVWETVSIDFENPLLFATNGPGTNRAGLVVRSVDPNVALENFVLSSLSTNYVNGLMHFTDNTNVARIPIKFASWPFSVSNFPPQQVFANGFEDAPPGEYGAGSTIQGQTNGFGSRNWRVVSGSVTVVSNNVMDMEGTNWLALSRGRIECDLPTVVGRRYQLSYALRGPGAVSWWNGDISPYSGRARDLLGGNEGAFINRATNSVAALVGNQSLYLPGRDTNRVAAKIELADPENLRLTNGFTIETWVYAEPHTNYFGAEQLFFRGDDRGCFDPYYLALERSGIQGQRNLRLHIDDGLNVICGTDLVTADAPIAEDAWQHVAAVFEPFVAIPDAPFITNQLRLYVNGSLVASNYTGMFPFGNLDERYLPGVAIGNRSREDQSEPFTGYLDELTVYGRVLTPTEISAISAAWNAGKADLSAAPSYSLAKARLLIDNVQMDVGYGNNAAWDTRIVTFTAYQTNTVLSLEGLLPGTMVNSVALTEFPAELSYLPEESLDALIGEDAYGLWTLEIIDTRAGATNNNPELVQWQIDFKLVPGVQPAPATLVHGMVYTNSLTAGGSQNFIVPVPQWASYATNVLVFATNRLNGDGAPLSIFLDTNAFPTVLTPPALIGPASNGVAVLSTNTLPPPFITPGQSYYLAITNPLPVAVTFALGVWFDVTPLTNCQPQTNYVGPAGIPRYFQFDVPTNAVPPGDAPRDVVFWLSGVRTNVTVVFSQSLPLPDLRNYDYLSQANSTNDEIIMLMTNTTPYPLQNYGRWYAGVFNSEATNVPFTVQVCYSTVTNYPAIIPLTNHVPYVASLTNEYVAPPGPPRDFFFEFTISNYVDAVLFELYDTTGDLDLVLQRYQPSGMAPYFRTSLRTGRGPEQIVLRPQYELPDLRGRWYLGLHNRESTNVAYTIRASTPVDDRLESGQPLLMTVSPAIPPSGPVLSWNGIEGELYYVEFSPGLFPPDWRPVTRPIVAPTPYPAIEVTTATGTSGFYRLNHMSHSQIFTAPLTIQYLPGNRVRISWPIEYAGFILQFYYPIGLTGVWQNSPLPVTIEGDEFVVYDDVGSIPKWYRVVP